MDALMTRQDYNLDMYKNSCQRISFITAQDGAAHCGAGLMQNAVKCTKSMS
jgi:hypothetical protein